MLSGSIENNKLTHDSVTIGNTEIELGSSSSTLTGLTGITVNGSSGLKLKNGSNSAGFLELYGTNSTNKITLRGQATTSDSIITLPTTTGTVITSGDTGTITNNMLNGSISNDKLVNQSISLGGVSINLGGSDNTPAFNLTDSTNYQTSNLVGTITNDQLAGSISVDKLVSSSINLSADSGLTGGGSVSLGGTSTLGINVDDNSIEINSGFVSVKSGGITNDMLAGSINIATKTTGNVPIGRIPTKNENDMVSNSNVHVPTQSSVKSFVESSISNLVDSGSPSALDTLNELAGCFRG